MTAVNIDACLPRIRGIFEQTVVGYYLLLATVCVAVQSTTESDTVDVVWRVAKVSTLVIKCTIIRFTLIPLVFSLCPREGEVQLIYVADSSSSALIANELDTNSNTFACYFTSSQ